MFTGIVEEIGKVEGTRPGKLSIGAEIVMAGTRLGDSIDVNGVCLTVTALGSDNFTVDIMPETLRLTNIGKLHYGAPVNLERAVPADGRFGGHFVQGHVDGTGKVMSLLPEDGAIIARISAPVELMPYIVSKGFIAVDGVSLTVTDYDDVSFSVSLVSYTKEHTILGIMKPGDVVNLEVDIIAKYVEKLHNRDERGVTIDFLEEHGFLKAR